MPLPSTGRHNLKRLHSLTGVVPIGVFLLEHFFTNSYAMFGAEVYNEHVRVLTSLPYVIAVEILGIGLPIAFHAILGVSLWWSSRGNVATYGYLRNWMYYFQRATGLLLLAFISIHVYKTRLSGVAPSEMFQHMEGYLDPGQHPSNWIWVAFYALGVVSASFHFGNGLFTFGISWGLLPGVRSQRWASRVCMGIFVLLSLVGLNSLRSFSGHGVQLLNHPDAVPKHGAPADEAAHDGPRAGALSP